MLAGVLRKLSPARLAWIALALLGVAALLFVPSRSYLFLPTEAKPVAPLVEVERRGAAAPRDARGGGIYFVSVGVDRASVLESLIPGLHEGSTLVPEEQITPPGVSAEERRTEGLRKMARSQEIAAAVALRTLGHEVAVRRTGALVSGIAEGTPAAGKLEPGDVVGAVDGRRVRTPAALRRAISVRPPGADVRLGVRRGGRVRTVELTTVASPDDRRRSIIGVFVEDAVEIRLPFRVRIDTGDIGGPSAGLAFALDVMEELGRDVDRGYRVAATGELELDGTVRSVGGVKQKTIGARRAEVDVLIVPAGENAREARRHADGLRVVAVKTFRQALRELATLRRRR